MRRRQFITMLGGAAAMWPLTARARQPERVRRIVVWVVRAEDDAEGQRLVTAFRQGLQALGWIDGRNIRTDYRWELGDSDHRQTLAKEIVEQRPDVIAVESTVRVAALARESRAIPIVFVNVSDPIGNGFVASLARPCGTITGFTSNEPTLGSKWPELLKEIAPGVGRMGFLFNPDTAPYAEAFLQQAEPAARAIGVELITIRVHNDAEIERAITALGSEPGSGLILLPEPTTNARNELIIELAARSRVPAIYAFRVHALGGGLLSYGVDPADEFRGAASYVDRILRGAKPADLPVQAPTKFLLVVNLKTAKALGLSVPPTLLVQADEVIQ
jgi:putative tryptophan/tyrosine transport system substrate-binding protein